MAWAMWIGVFLGVLSCVSYAAAAVAQRRLAVRLTGLGEGRMAALLRHPLWWISVVFNAGRAVFQVASVAFAPLTVVQPLGVLTLVIGIPWSARLGGRRVTRREWRGAGLTVLALGALLAVTVTSGGGGLLEPADTVALSAGAVAFLLVGAWVAHRFVSAAWRCYLLSAAAGVAFGVSAATAKTAVLVLTQEGTAGLIDPSLPATAVIAVSGLFLAQGAYQGMDLGAPLGITTLVNPVAASVVGVVFMGETYAGGWFGIAVAVVCGLGAAFGIRLLTVGDAPEPRPAEPEAVLSR
ncbi:DMT family transporter [Nocardiopsis xinjiangensis]|uniref:DMT family transporter n=1 Tax=Nocardiopsis xinjiangensis TaxID=124285 RepID=UPI0003792492|nr:DMT family transporter [Nocardiopsis xinjiangensis]